MGFRLPAYVSPKTPNHIRELEAGPGGLVETVKNFLSGKYDPTAEQFQAYLNVGDHRVQRATQDLRDSILASQGGQRIYGGAAGSQLNQALIDKIKDDLDREQVMLMDTLNQIVANRRYGLNAGTGLVDSARTYAIDSAKMANDYNYRAAASRYKPSTLDTVRSFLEPSADIAQSVSALLLA